MNEMLLTDGVGHFPLKGDRWENIAHVIKWWHKKYPVDSRRLKDDIARARADADNSVPGKAMRLGLLVDPRLMFYIQRFYPDFLDTKEDMRAFGRKFPQFVTSEKTVK